MFNNIVFYKTVDSTNDYLAKLVREKKAENKFVLVADFQTKGKGQRSNRWYSSRGKNLLFSLYLTPNDTLVKNKIYFNIITSLALVHTLKKYLINKKIKIKWPNDILVENCKISGILIETTVLKEKIKTVIIGVGININQARFTFNENNPTSINKILKKEVDRHAVLMDFLKFFSQFFNAFKEKKYEFLDQEYLSFLKDSAKFFKNRDAN